MRDMVRSIGLVGRLYFYGIIRQCQPFLFSRDKGSFKIPFTENFWAVHIKNVAQNGIVKDYNTPHI